MTIDPCGFTGVLTSKILHFPLLHFEDNCNLYAIQTAQAPDSVLIFAFALLTIQPHKQIQKARACGPDT